MILKKELYISFLFPDYETNSKSVFYLYIEKKSKKEE